MGEFVSVVMPLVLTLVVYGVPIAFGVRWLVRQRQRTDARIAALGRMPTQEQFEAMTDRLEALTDRLERLDERQAFLERLLEPGTAQHHMVPKQGGADFA